MKDIIIVGAGATAHEVIEVIAEQNRHGADWNIKGMLCDDLHALDNTPHYHSIIGTIKDWVPSGDEQYALGISMPKSKFSVVPGLLKRGFHFATLIDPSVGIPETTEIGCGTIIMSGSIIAPRARLGKFVSIQGSMIGMYTVMGDYCTTTGYSNIASAQLGDRVFVGSHAVILNHVKIGNGTTIGAGCIISRDIGENKIAFSPRPKVVDDPDL